MRERPLAYIYLAYTHHRGKSEGAPALFHTRACHNISRREHYSLVQKRYLTISPLFFSPKSVTHTHQRSRIKIKDRHRAIQQLSSSWQQPLLRSTPTLVCCLSGSSQSRERTPSDRDHSRRRLPHCMGELSLTGSNRKRGRARSAIRARRSRADTLAVYISRGPRGSLASERCSRAIFIVKGGGGGGW